MDSRSKVYILASFVFAVLLSGYVGFQVYARSVPNPEVSVIESGSMVQAYSYFIYYNGTTYNARNGTTGAIDYASAMFSTTFNTVQDLLVNGGVIQLADQRFPVSAELGIDYRGITLLGMGSNLTVLYATSNINILRVKTPNYGTAHNYMENYEAGEGITIRGIQFWDKADSPSQTSTACIVLDNSVAVLTGVIISECSFVGIYDGIVNYRSSSSNFIWANTIEKCKWSLFRHYAIYFENIADTVFSDLWMVTDASSVSAIYIEYKTGGSTKIGALMFDKVRVFNEKTVNTAHGLYMEDYHEVFISNCVFDFCGGWGAWFNNVYSLFVENSWFSSNSRAISGETGGILLSSNNAHESTYGNPYDVWFMGCKAENNEGGIGFSILGTSEHEMDEIHFTLCFARTNGGNDGIKLEYANHCTFVNCVSSTNGGHGFFDNNTCDYNAYLGCTARGNNDNWDLTSGTVQYHQSWDEDSFTD